MPDGYYSGDKPNPNLRSFVEAHLRERPYDPATDTYDVPAFTKSQTIENRRDPINDMHIYWSKKPYQAVRRYVEHYTKPGDLVLDPFVGSGGTVLAALLAGRNAIAVDRSPAATFITKNYCTPIDPSELQARYEQLEALVRPEIERLYETRCDRCDGRGVTTYTVYSQIFECPRCLARVPLFGCVVGKSKTVDGREKAVNLCPLCHESGHEEIIRSQSHKFGYVPVKVCYQCANGCKPARGIRRHDDADSRKKAYFEEYDLGKIETKVDPFVKTIFGAVLSWMSLLSVD